MNKASIKIDGGELIKGYSLKKALISHMSFLVTLYKFAPCSQT